MCRVDAPRIEEVVARGEKLFLFRTLMKEHARETVEYARAARQDNTDKKKRAISELMRNVDLWGSVINANERLFQGRIWRNEGLEWANIFAEYTLAVKKVIDGYATKNDMIIEEGEDALVDSRTKITEFFADMNPYSKKEDEISDMWAGYSTHTVSYIKELFEGEQGERSEIFWHLVEESFVLAAFIGVMLDSTLE